MVFFLILPCLLLFKLCRKIAKCCCRKKPATKEETEPKAGDVSDSETQGPEVDIFKEGDILRDGSPGSPSSRTNSKEHMVKRKRSHSTDSSGSSLVIKKSKHGSKENVASAGERRASTSRRGDEGKMEAEIGSDITEKASVAKSEPSVRTVHLYIYLLSLLE